MWDEKEKNISGGEPKHAIGEGNLDATTKGEKMNLILHCFICDDDHFARDYTKKGSNQCYDCGVYY